MSGAFIVLCFAMAVVLVAIVAEFVLEVVRIPFRIEKDLGGPEALCRTFATAGPLGVRVALWRAGIPYRSVRRPRVPLVKWLPKEWRGVTRIDGAYYFVDAFGRPCGALVVLPRFVDLRPRNEYVQGVVGRWGDAEGLDCDGGHVLAYCLGGDDSRLNTIPEAKVLNRGQRREAEERGWKRASRYRASGGLVYYVRIEYRDDRTIIASHIAIMTYAVRAGRMVSSERFENTNRPAQAA